MARHEEGKPMVIKAIETHYKGYRFRSRLEARWAVYFDAIGLIWEYEKEGFDVGYYGWYLPDFWLPQVGMWAEAKPELLSLEEYMKLEKLVLLTGHYGLMLEGTPTCKTYDYLEPNPNQTLLPDGWERRHNSRHCSVVDCVISMYHDYPRTERRFYSSTGGVDHHDFAPDGMFEDVPAAVEAARSARFEYGENDSRGGRS